MAYQLWVGTGRYGTQSLRTDETPVSRQLTVEYYVRFSSSEVSQEYASLTYPGVVQVCYSTYLLPLALVIASQVAPRLCLSNNTCCQDLPSDLC